ncbi:MAG: hypothetical protein IJ752_02895 [Alphaproteobacteria bacterium]|nr:hypothetical protein [Alphaproteobacteria bacterium]
MSSPTVSLQNSGPAAQTASASTVIPLPDAPPEMTELPAGFVLPAVLTPPETSSALPIMQLTLPNGKELAVPVKLAHVLRVSTPVSIKILPADLKKTFSVRIHFSAPLPDIKKAAQNLQTVAAERPRTDIISPSAKKSIPLRAFVLHSVSEQITALMNELTASNEEQLPPLTPHQTVQIELSPAPNAPVPPISDPQISTPQPTASAQPAQSMLSPLPDASAAPMPEEMPVPQTAEPEQTAIQSAGSPQVVLTDSLKGTPAVNSESTAAVTASSPSAPSQTPVPDSPAETPSLLFNSPLSRQETPALPSIEMPTEKEAAPTDFVPAVSPQTPSSSFSETLESTVLPVIKEETEPVTAAAAEKTSEKSAVQIPLKGVVFDFKTGSAPLVVTEVGVLALEEEIHLPHLTPVTVQITQTIEPLFFTVPEAAEKNIFQSISETLNLLQQSDSPSAFEAVKNVLPQIGNKLPAQILSFISASTQNVPLASLIGEANAAAIQSLGEKGQRLFQKMEKDFAVSSKKASDGRTAWKGWTVPFLSGAIVEPVSLYLQKPQEEAAPSKGTNAKQNAVRFVLDLTLTRLGKLQMDGLAHRSERRFDLIMRHQKDLPVDFDDAVRRIFTQTLSALNYTGTVKVDHTDQFILLTEQIEQETKRGVWA